MLSNEGRNGGPQELDKAAASDRLHSQNEESYKYDLVNPLTDEATCPVCLDLAVKPHLVDCCGQHFCQQCLESVRAKENVCPFCRKVAPTSMHDKYFERNVINCQLVRCTARKNGCHWEGPLAELQRHVMVCQFFEEDCPYGCGTKEKRFDLERHKSVLCPWRPFECGYCDHHGTYREVTDQHWPLCKSFPLDCPNNCGTKNIPRGELQEHFGSKCRLQEVACDFNHAGCKIRVVRQDLPQHMSDAAQQHMALVSHTLLQDKEREIAQLKQQLREKEQQYKEEMTRKDLEHKKQMEAKDELVDVHCRRVAQLEELLQSQLMRVLQKTDSVVNSVAPESIIFYMSGYRGKGNRIDWYSPPYYTHARGYKMCIGVYMRIADRSLDIYSYLLPGEYDAGLKWPFRGTVVVKLLNQLSDDNHYDYLFDYSQASDEESQRVMSGKRSKFMLPTSPHLLLTDLDYNSTNNTRYLRSNCLKFRVIVHKMD